MAEAAKVAGTERSKLRQRLRSLSDKRRLCVAPIGSVLGLFLPALPEDRRNGVLVTSVPIGAAVAPFGSLENEAVPRRA